MNRTKILENLCMYDTRNPRCPVNEEGFQAMFGPAERALYGPRPREGCTCFNCMQGRARLVGQVLPLLELDLSAISGALGQARTCLEGLSSGPGGGMPAGRYRDALEALRMAERELESAQGPHLKNNLL